MDVHLLAQVIDALVDRVDEHLGSPAVSDEDHVIVSGKVKLTDIVGYVGLVAGQKYVVNGTLMGKANGKVLEVDGKAVTATAEFTAEKSAAAWRSSSSSTPPA